MLQRVDNILKASNFSQIFSLEFLTVQIVHLFTLWLSPPISSGFDFSSSSLLNLLILCAWKISETDGVALDSLSPAFCFA